MCIICTREEVEIIPGFNNISVFPLECVQHIDVVHKQRCLNLVIVLLLHVVGTRYRDSNVEISIHGRKSDLCGMDGRGRIANGTYKVGFGLSYCSNKYVVPKCHILT